MLSKASEMQFINNAVCQRDIQRLVELPIETAVDNSSMPSLVAVLWCSPNRAPRHCPSVRIQEYFIAVEAIDERVLVRRAFHPEPVMNAGVQTEQEGMPHISSTVQVRIKRKLDQRLRL